MVEGSRLVVFFFYGTNHINIDLPRTQFWMCWQHHVIHYNGWLNSWTRRGLFSQRMKLMKRVRRWGPIWKHTYGSLHTTIPDTCGYSKFEARPTTNFILLMIFKLHAWILECSKILMRKVFWAKSNRSEFAVMVLRASYDCLWDTFFAFRCFCETFPGKRLTWNRNRQQKKQTFGCKSNWWGNTATSLRYYNSIFLTTFHGLAAGQVLSNSYL